MNAVTPSGAGRWGTPVRVVALQAVVTVAAAALAIAWSMDEAKSAFLGGLVALLPNAYFAWAVSRGGKDAVQEAALEGGRFLGRWLVKMGLVVALLVATLAVWEVGSPGFFLGLVAVLMAQFAGPLVAGGERAEEYGPRARD